MTDKSKNTLASFIGATALVGLGLYWLMGVKNERKLEREAFDKLDLSAMSPRAVWDAALDLSRTRRRELSAENAHLTDLVDNAAGLIEISEGLQKCATMLADKSVPEEVKAPILKHWNQKWWRFLGYDFTLMERLFENLDHEAIDKVRQQLRTFDRERAKADAQAKEERSKEGDHGVLCCSFCGKSQNEVRKIIAGPSVYICDECVELCVEIVTTEASDGRTVKTREELQAKIQEMSDALALLPKPNDWPFACTRCGKGLNTHDVEDHECKGQEKIDYLAAFRGLV